jgi:hypothetical protein
MSNDTTPERKADKLTTLITEDLGRESERIGSQKASVDQLRNEMTGTVLSLIKDLGMSVLEFRNWAAFSHKEHSDHLDEHEARLALLEDSVFSGGTQLSQQDADMFSMVVAAAESFAEQAIKVTVDSAGKSKLQQVLDLCKQARVRIEESTVSEDEDDDDDEDGDEQDDDQQVVATRSNPGRATAG